MQPQLIGGRYQVQTAIGQGGMGTVWLCQDEKLAREVAVKQVGLLPGESVTDSARALREARSSAALSHRNVVTVFDVVEEDGRIWMVMENIPSRALSDLISDEGALPPETVAAIGAQVADGLASAHAAGITHRDVKPGNVLVRDDGLAKISDFGIARTAGDPALTQTGLFIGTPMYFSPELARGAEPDPAADVWALGATLYAAVEGRPPYEQKTNAMAVISEIAHEPPTPPQRAGILEPVLSRMLDRDPSSRWSMADAAHALNQLAARNTERTRTSTTAAFAGVAAGARAGADVRARDRTGDTVSAGPASTTTEPRPATPPAGEPRPAPAPPRDRGKGRKKGPLYVGLLTLAALLLVGGLLFTTLGEDDPGRPSAADEPTPAASGPGDASGDASPEADAEQTPADAEPTPADVGAAQTAFLEDYYGTVPGDLDAGWSMLGPGMRSVGRDSYNDFWGSVESAQVSEISPNTGGGSADVTLRYVMKDGRVSVERQRIDLVRGDDGNWLINGDTPIG